MLLGESLVGVRPPWPIRAGAARASLWVTRGLSAPPRRAAQAPEGPSTHLLTGSPWVQLQWPSWLRGRELYPLWLVDAERKVGSCSSSGVGGQGLRPQTTPSLEGCPCPAHSVP